MALQVCGRPLQRSFGLRANAVEPTCQFAVPRHPGQCVHQIPAVMRRQLRIDVDIFDQAVDRDAVKPAEVVEQAFNRLAGEFGSQQTRLCLRAAVRMAAKSYRWVRTL